MKRTFYLKIISFLVSSFFYISCTNWSENPETTKKDDTVILDQGFESDVWHSVNLPVGTTAFFPYSKDLVFAGTAEGNLYVSYDHCTTWSLATLNTKNKAPIKCISYVNISKKSFEWGTAVACSDKGVYRSKDMGKSWYEINTQPAYYNQSEVNSITFGLNYYETNNNSFLITQELVIAGKFDTNNALWCSFHDYAFRSDTPVNIDLNPTNFGYPKGRVKTMYYSSNYYYCGFNDSNSGFIYSGNPIYAYWPKLPEKITNLGNNNNVNAFAEISSKNIILAGASKGLYASSDRGQSWSKINSNLGVEINFLKINTAGILFAGTPKGLFASRNQGSTWVEISLELGTPIEAMEIGKDDFLYIKIKNKEFYLIKTDANDLLGFYPPILSYPENNSTGIDTNLTFKWLNVIKEKPSFWFQVSTKEDFSSEIIFEKRYIKGNNYTLLGLKREIKYYWRIKSTKIYSQTNWSEVWNFTTK